MRAEVVSCESRHPVVGDRVKCLNAAQRILHRISGWDLHPNEFATVVEVDDDGDFRLRNQRGVESRWTYRKSYAYVPGIEQSACASTPFRAKASAPAPHKIVETLQPLAGQRTATNGVSGGVSNHPSLSSESILEPYAPLRIFTGKIFYKSRLDDKVHSWMDGKQLWVETTVSPDDFDSWALAELSHIENGSGEPGMLASLHAARANRLPKFRDDVQAEQSMARYTEGLARHLEDEIAKVEAVIGGLDTEATDVEDCMSTTIEAMTAWKASKDAELGIALRDAVISADAARATGNHKFQTGRFIESFEEYKIGIQCLEGFSAHTLSADARKLHVTLLLNACQALLKTGIAGASSEGAYELASKALALEPTNIKALYRRGCACAISGNDHLARDDFEQVLRLDPLNVAAKDQLRNLGVMLEESRPKPNHTSANHASTNHASSKVGPSTLPGQSPDHASTKVSTKISLNSRASPSRPPKAAQGLITLNLAQSLTEASPGSHPTVSCGCVAGDQVQWRGVDDPMPSGGVGTVVSVTESKVQVRFANHIRFCSPDEIVKVTSPVATPAPSCSLAVVFFDFDSTLSAPQYVHRANDYAVCDRIELCCSLTEDEVIANFGGPERLANLLDMLEYLEQGGVNLFIISLGFTRAISHHLGMVKLDRFFDSDRIYGQDSESFRQLRHKKASLIEQLLGENCWQKSQALFVDDDERNIGLCREMGACNVLHVRGHGLCKAEMDVIKAELER